MGQAPDEAGLVARALAGQSDAAEEIARLCWPRFYRVALGILAQSADAEDAAQEALVRLLERLGRFDPARGGFSSWAYRIATNVALDKLRERARRRELASDAPRTVAAEAEDPAEEASDRELVRMVIEAIGGLPDQQRAVIALRDGEGLSTEEVAKILDSTRGNVRAQLYYARKKIASVLASKGAV